MIVNYKNLNVFFWMRESIIRKVENTPEHEWSSSLSFFRFVFMTKKKNNSLQMQLVNEWTVVTNPLTLKIMFSLRFFVPVPLVYFAWSASPLPFNSLILRKESEKRKQQLEYVNITIPVWTSRISHWSSLVKNILIFFKFS